MGVARQEALALQRAADALGDALDESLQLLLPWRSDAPKHQRPGADQVRAVEHQHVQVNIEIERRAKSLDQRHRARRAACAREPRPLERTPGSGARRARRAAFAPAGGARSPAGSMNGGARGRARSLAMASRPCDGWQVGRYCDTQAKERRVSVRNACADATTLARRAR